MLLLEDSYLALSWDSLNSRICYLLVYLPLYRHPKLSLNPQITIGLVFIIIEESHYARPAKSSEPRIRTIAMFS
jgi:hypothetical protein